MVYAGVAALIAGVVAGLGSAWHASRGAVSTTLREGGRGGSHGPSRARVRNVLVPGRASGGDRIAHASTRNMSCCAVQGQGAGVAAAVSLHTGADLHDVDLTMVQRELERQGVRYR